jgi:hypothetical protein
MFTTLCGPCYSLERTVHFHGSSAAYVLLRELGGSDRVRHVGTLAGLRSVVLWHVAEVLVSLYGFLGCQLTAFDENFSPLLSLGILWAVYRSW